MARKYSHKIYEGEFLSRAGVRWGVSLYRVLETMPQTIGELTFDADEPVVIEYPETEPHEALCPSNMTLRIISPGDRTYADLYHVTPGEVGVIVKRNGSIYWLGVMDPEIYEEPYESARGYVVQMTFSDLGIFDRMKFNGSGLNTIEGWLLNGLTSISFIGNNLDINTDFVKTYLGAESFDVVTDEKVFVRADNFYDEDGEPKTWKEVFEALLTPLNIRMIQKEGEFRLYNFEGLLDDCDWREIEWSGDSQTLGSAKVYRKINVTFSPYAGGEIAGGELEYKGKHSPDVTANTTKEHPLNVSWIPASEAEFYGEWYSYFPDFTEDNQYNGAPDRRMIDFHIFRGLNAEVAEGVESINQAQGCRPAYIEPVNGSAQSECVICDCMPAENKSGCNFLGEVFSFSPRTVFTSKRFYVPAASDDILHSRQWLHYTQDACLSYAYNPYTSDYKGNDFWGIHRNMVESNLWPFIFMPVRITLHDKNGNILYHYKNAHLANDSVLQPSLLNCMGQWVEGDDPGHDCYLEYYDPEDPKKKAGAGGWVSNHPVIGRPDGKNNRFKYKPYPHFKKLTGEYMPLPPVAGYLQIEIKGPVVPMQWDEDAANIESCRVNKAQRNTHSQWYHEFHWRLFRAPKVEIVSNATLKATERDDVEYSGELIDTAEEELNIDTICGSGGQDIPPTAKGLYLDEDGQPITTFRRGGYGYQGPAEELLIGTLCSQYGDRHITLQGETYIDIGLHIYEEANQPDVTFIKAGETENVITDTTEATFREISEDYYHKNSQDDGEEL